MKKLYPLLSLLFLIYCGCEDKKGDKIEPNHPLVGIYNAITITDTILSNPIQAGGVTPNGVTMRLENPDVYSFQGKIDFWGNVTNAIGTWSYDDGSCCGGYPKLILLNTNITTSNLNTEIWDLISSLDDTNYLIMRLSQPETDTTWGLLKTYTFEKEE